MNEIIPLRGHYERVAQNRLRIIWRGKWLIFTALLVGLALSATVLALLEPRFTGEAIIQFSFNREEPAPTKSQLIASLDAAALVDSAARIIRSRETASAVVTRLGLDKDPTFARQPIVWRAHSYLRSHLGSVPLSAYSYLQSAQERVHSYLRSTLGLELVTAPNHDRSASELVGPEQAPSSDYDIAVSRVMELIKVTNDPRSYLVTVAVTTRDPEQSALLANTVAIEYLRGQLLQQLTESKTAAEREMMELSSVYGVRHPIYLGGLARLERLQARLSTMRESASTSDVLKLVVGQSLRPAETVMVPSGPNVVAIVAFIGAASLGLGIWLAWLRASAR